MPRIFDHCGREVDRILTIRSLLDARRMSAVFAQVTAETEEEAAAAEEAGIEMAVCRSPFVTRVRDGSKRVFLTAAIDFAGAVSNKEMLTAAFDAMKAGADAVITSRNEKTIRRIAKEDIPVFGHLGFVPKNSSAFGGIRAIGKTAEEATYLWEQFLRLEDAGAIGVECELIPAELMSEINKRTGLVTVSLGSGPNANVIFLFTSDICGESGRLPRHAKAYGDIASLKTQIAIERVKALSKFRQDVDSTLFPAPENCAAIDNQELQEFLGFVGERQMKCD